MKKLTALFFSFAIALSSFAAITIAPTNLAGVNDTAYCQYQYYKSFTASGGSAPYHYTVSVGTLPAGLQLDSLTGVLSGILGYVNSTNVTFTIKGRSTVNSQSGTRAYTIYVRNKTLTNPQLTNIWAASKPPIRSDVYATWWNIRNPADTIPNEWLLTGNTVGEAKKIGTIDSVAFPIITKNTERARFKATGEFGIGTTTPLAPLHVYKTSGQVARFQTAAMGDPKVSWYDDTFELGYITTKRTDGNKMFFGSNGIEAFRIASQNVGIGYSDGNTRFYVNNATGLTYSFIVDGGGANAICVTGSGDKVGIGTTSPEVKFDVGGVAQVKRFQDATGGGTLQPSNLFRLQSAYWNGSASVSRFVYWRLNQLSTAPLEETALYNQADTKLFSVNGNGVPFFSGIPAYTDNASALSGGLVAGQVYYTDTAGEYILKVVH